MSDLKSLNKVRISNQNKIESLETALTTEKINLRDEKLKHKVSSFKFQHRRCSNLVLTSALAFFVGTIIYQR